MADARRFEEDFKGSLISGLRPKIREEALNLIALKREGPTGDFKKEWHKDNSELIHDMLCLANNLESDVSYLFIGIDEEEDYSVSMS